MPYKYEPYRMGRWLVGEKAWSFSWGRYSEKAFGKVAPYRCSECGPSWEETPWSRGDAYPYCPHCGAIETHGENQDGNPITVKRRYRIPRRRSA